MSEIRDMVEGLRLCPGNEWGSEFQQDRNVGSSDGIFKLASGNCAPIDLVSKCRNFKKNQPIKGQHNLDSMFLRATHVLINDTLGVYLLSRP